MPIYYGRSADGSDMREFRGVYINPDNENEWSTEPYTKEQKVYDRIHDKWDFIYNHIALHERSLQDELNLVLAKKSELSSTYRKMLLDAMNENGND